MTTRELVIFDRNPHHPDWLTLQEDNKAVGGYSFIGTRYGVGMEVALVMVYSKENFGFCIAGITKSDVEKFLNMYEVDESGIRYVLKEIPK